MKIHLLISSVFSVVLFLFLASCAAVHRPAATVKSIQADGEAARSAHRGTVDAMIDHLARRAVARGDRTLDILLLSGGGHDAYGIGFLRGWRGRAGAPMPRFDLVTGISTGALQAPLVLLGTEEALNRASKSATSVAPVGLGVLTALVGFSGCFIVP